MSTADQTVKKVLDYLEANGEWVVDKGVGENGKWYRVYKDGWVEQGGKGETVGLDGSKTIILLKEMADTNYYVNWISCGGYVVTGAGTRAATDLTTTSFIVRNGQDCDMTVNWFVCGKAKE